MRSNRHFTAVGLSRTGWFIIATGSQAGVEPSVGNTGDSYDNALAETINGLYKTELIHKQGPWKTVEALEWETLKWVTWFNQQRLLEPIGNRPPAEFEALYEQSQAAIPVAA